MENSFIYFKILYLLILKITHTGFLSLEEIDEADYGLQIPDLEDKKKKKSKHKTDLKEHKQSEIEGACNDVAGAKFEEKKDEGVMTKKKEKKKEKKEKKKEKKEEKKKEKKKNVAAGKCRCYIYIYSCSNCFCMCF